MLSTICKIVRRRNPIQLNRKCQRGLVPAAFLVGAALLLAPSRAVAISPQPQPPASVPAAVGTPLGGAGQDVVDMLRRLSRMHVEGSLSLNWRNVGPRKPGFETQIQDEVYLADMYFGADGPFVDQVPFQIEFHLPTAGQGRIELNQLNFQYNRIDNATLQFGKFLIPFGRYNELYRPDQFLTVTRPLLFASPDSLDLVVRLNSPRPPLTSGYTDIGARASYY